MPKKTTKKPTSRTRKKSDLSANVQPSDDGTVVTNPRTQATFTYIKTQGHNLDQLQARQAHIHHDLATPAISVPSVSGPAAKAMLSKTDEHLAAKARRVDWILLVAMAMFGILGILSAQDGEAVLTTTVMVVMFILCVLVFVGRGDEINKIAP